MPCQKIASESTTNWIRSQSKLMSSRSNHIHGRQFWTCTTSNIHSISIFVFHTGSMMPPWPLLFDAVYWLRLHRVEGCFTSDTEVVGLAVPAKAMQQNSSSPLAACKLTTLASLEHACLVSWHLMVLSVTLVSFVFCRSLFTSSGGIHSATMCGTR